MEGLLQSFKFDKPHIQEVVCTLTGLTAKYRGRQKNKAWKSKQTLWWKGKEYKRDSNEYQDLLDRAYAALSENDSSRRALLATRNANLTHRIDKNKISETVLTQTESCSRLMKIRRII